MMPCPFSEKHLPSQATGLALLPARKATPGPGSGSCCARGGSALRSSTKVPVAANLKLKPQPQPEELATERPLRPLRDRKSTRLHSSHSQISYAGLCFEEKTT